MDESERLKLYYEKIATMPKPPEDLSQAALVTHVNCMDGAGCSILFELLGGTEVKFVGAGTLKRFIENDPLMTSDKFLIFADVGVTESEEADLLEKRGNCVLIDHHRTSAHMIGRPWAHIDCEGNSGNACGCKLLLTYLGVSRDLFNKIFMQNPEVIDLVEAIDDNDRWLQRDPRSAEMATYMTFVGQKRFIDAFSDLSRWRSDRCGECFQLLSMSHPLASHRLACTMNPVGPFFEPNKTILDAPADLWRDWEVKVLEIIQDQKDKNVDRLLQKISEREFYLSEDEVYRVGYVVSSEQNVSQLLGSMLDRNPHLDVACQISIDKGAVSLRSRGNVDVSRIAMMFDGGGHRAAAGHQLPPNLVPDIIDLCHGI